MLHQESSEASLSLSGGLVCFLRALTFPAVRTSPSRTSGSGVAAFFSTGASTARQPMSTGTAPVGAEFVAAHHDAQARRFVGIVRVMGGDEAARHQVVQRFLIRRHRPGAALGGDDGVVVGDFRGVVKAFGIHMGD